MHVWRKGDSAYPQLCSRSSGHCPFTTDLAQPSRSGLVQRITIAPCFNGANSGAEVATARRTLASVPLSSRVGQSEWSAKGYHCGRANYQTERVAIQLCVMLHLSLQPGQKQDAAGDYKDLSRLSVSSTIFAAAHIQWPGPKTLVRTEGQTQASGLLQHKVNRRGRPSGFRGGASTSRTPKSTQQVVGHPNNLRSVGGRNHRDRAAGMNDVALIIS